MSVANATDPSATTRLLTNASRISEIDRKAPMCPVVKPPWPSANAVYSTVATGQTRKMTMNAATGSASSHAPPAAGSARQGKRCRHPVRRRSAAVAALGRAVAALRRHFTALASSVAFA